MKTSDFIQKASELGYYVQWEDYFMSVKGYDSQVKCTIHKMYQDSLLLTTGDLKLIKLCTEYAETPPHEREDVKKYIAKIPDPENLSTERIYTLVRAFNGNIMISRPQTKRILENEAYHLTEEEIKRNHSYLWEFAEEVK